jgi:ferric-dicitrate binding protein FerR (iron transport regulator)
VEKNEEAPFYVHTDEIDIRVLGTCFNVKSYPEDDVTETTLVEGLITVSKKGSEEGFRLRPNEKASLEKDAAGQTDGSLVITKNI